MKQYTTGLDRILQPDQSITLQQTEAKIISAKRSGHTDGYPQYVGVDSNYSLYGLVNQHAVSADGVTECVVLLSNRPRSGTIYSASLKVQTRDTGSSATLPVTYPAAYLWVLSTTTGTGSLTGSTSTPTTPPTDMAAYRATLYTLGINPVAPVPFLVTDMLLLRLSGESFDAGGTTWIHASSFYDLSVTFKSTLANPVIF